MTASATGVSLSPAEIRAFIEANTKLLSPPLVPELRLHLAEESLPIWEKTEEQLGEMNVEPPFWAFAWAGGQAIARYLIDHPEVCRDKRVLDLGSGSGLAGLASLKAGALWVVAADIDRFAGVAADLNAAANGLTLTVVSHDLLTDGFPEVDLILVGDLFYASDLARSVLAALERETSHGVAVLVGDPRRSYFPVEKFELLADYSVPVTRELEDAEIKASAVWALKPNPTSRKAVVLGPLVPDLR